MALNLAEVSRETGLPVRNSLRVVALLLVAILASEHLAWALDGDKAAYFGGTATVFGTPKDPVEGLLDTTNEVSRVLTAVKKPLEGKALAIPYGKISGLEYGQKAGRRVGAAVGTAVLLGPLGLLTLFSKKRKHYLTVGYKDDADKDQVAVIELGKDLVRTTLAVVQARSGKAIEYQDDEARKSAK